MKARSTTVSACLIALLALGAAAYLERPAVRANEKERFEFAAEIEYPFEGKPLKGAPFSAQVVFEQTQTLANGVHLSHKRNGALYRDSEGRTRQEFPRDGSPEVVQINDNVGGVIYNLHLFQRTVHKVNISHAKNREIEEVKRHREMEEHALKLKLTPADHEKKEGAPENRVESLGIQSYEGLQAEVTRFTIMIPAGMEGNDRAFEIVTERWYSPELHILLMGKRSDPRSGDMVYRLTNISRAEQPHSLFEAPADFTVTEEKTEFRRKEKH
jgi:hypothetical protein